MSETPEVRPLPLASEIALLPGGAGFEERVGRTLSIANSVNAVVAQLPADKQFAVVAHASLRGAPSASLSAFIRLDGGWSFAGTFGHTKSEGFSGEAALVFSR